jgi:hypothetical protein
MGTGEWMLEALEVNFPGAVFKIKIVLAVGLCCRRWRNLRKSGRGMQQASGNT